MRKTTLSALLAAGLVAVAGVAQAETFDVPTQAGEASTMTNGQPNALTTNSPYSEDGSTAVLGAGPSTTTVTTYTYTYPPTVSHVYSTPSYAVPASPYWDGYAHGGAETSNVPLRAGEASTMTGGAPNMVTNNYSW
jgi:hypothetical protein